MNVLINMSSKQKIFFILFHLFLGFLIIKINIVTFYSVIILLFATYIIFTSKDEQGVLPLYFCSYLGGLEIVLRMAKANIFWEFGKYSIIYCLLLGFLKINKTVKIPILALYYFVLLIPAIIGVPMESFNSWRQDISFNLSGPLVLFISSIYFYNVKLSKDEILSILFYSTLPIITMSIYNIIQMPDLLTYKFLPYSDSSTSGGYGPNQVATMFGLGIINISLAQLFKKTLFIKRYIDFIFLAIFFFLGLITFSRGGILVASVSLIISVSYYILYQQKVVNILFKITGLLLIFLTLWYFIFSLTDGVIADRYGISSKEGSGNILSDLSGRSVIYNIDFQIFKDHILSGVGLGQGTYMRESYGYGKVVAAHIEFTRMLAEHGFLGLVSIFFLLSIPIVGILNSKIISNRVLILTFSIFSLLTMSHSAMRLAYPSFIFGIIYCFNREEF